MPPPRPGPILRWLFHAPVWVYRCRGGRLLGHRFLLLHHTGRRSGQPRQTVLEVIAYDPGKREAVVMSGFGPRANWLRNIQACPDFAVTVGSASFAAEVRFLGDGEAAVVLATYERRNRFVRPIVRAVLSELLGWRYDGSPDAQYRAVRQLPLVAFRPRA